MVLDRTENESTQIPVSDETTAPAPADTAPAISTQPAESDSVKDVTIDGYTFKVDMDVVDDVDNLELINKIEQGGYLYGIIEFLQKIVGNDGYDKLKAYFVEKNGKLSLTKLGEIYQAIFEQFSPKG